MATTGFMTGGGYGGAGTISLPRPAAPLAKPLARPLARPGAVPARPATAATPAAGALGTNAANAALGGGPGLGVSNNPNAHPAAITGDWNAMHPARAAWRAQHPVWAQNHPITMAPRQQAQLYGQGILPQTRQAWAASRRASIPQEVIDQGGLAASLAWRPDPMAGVQAYAPTGTGGPIGGTGGNTVGLF